MHYNKKENLSKPLVSIKTEHAMEHQQPPACPVEPAFRIPGYRGLWLEAGNWNREAANFLASRSARTPGDLRNHVQRINHQIQQENPDGAYGALLDLFIILEDRGRPLRARMLKSARHLLRNEWFEQLYRRLDSGITALDAMPLSHSSLLSKGYVGSYQLVEKISEDSVHEKDPIHAEDPVHEWDVLQEARSHLEYDQVDQARTVLEAAILKGSVRLDVHEDLLEIYKHTRDKSNFLKMHQQLNIKNKTVLGLWLKLAAFFGEGK